MGDWGLDIELVVADCAYGMAIKVVRFLQTRQWSYALALRSDFGMDLPESEQVWHKPWVKVACHLSDVVFPTWFGVLFAPSGSSHN